MSSILLGIVVSLALSGQPPGVGGIVVDPSGQPVPGARVACGGRTATTAEDGRFAFPGAAGCQAAVSAPGFETRRIDLDGAGARVELSIAALQERVVVSATRQETELEKAGVAATVLRRDDLETRQFPAVAELLREVPGLQVARYGRPGSLTQVFARGGQRTATLLMIDGVPVNDPGGEINLAGFASGALDRIEVVRAPESALFGAEAASGVIQLFTRRGDSERRLPRGSLAYDRGSYGTDRWMANLGGGSGGAFDYMLSAEQYHTAGEYPNDDFRNTTGTANLGLRLSPATQVRGIVRIFDSGLGVPNQVAYRVVDRDARETTRDSLVALRLEDVRGPRYVQRIAFGYHRSHDLFADPGMDGPFELAALVRDSPAPVPRVYLERLVDPAAADALNPAPPLRLERRSVTLFPSPEPFLSLTSRKNFDYQGTLAHAGGSAVFGYEYERQGGQITGRGVSRDNHGVFAHEQHVVGGRLFLSGGLRLERSSAFGTKFAPRGAASYRLAPATYVRASAGLGITEPSLLQNYASDPYFIGNLSLRPEKTAAYEAGIVQEWFTRRLRVEAAAFHNSFRDLIVFVFLPFPEPSTWQNVESSRARGLEFTAQARPARWLALSGSYTRMWTRITRSSSPNSLFTGVGQELARRPGNAGALAVSVTPRRWSFQAGSVLVGERQDTDLFGVTRNPGYQNIYAAASLRLDRRVTPFLRADNLLNSAYQEILGYPAPSRRISGGLRVEW
jgi:outer membrane cobalamin receptor